VSLFYPVQLDNKLSCWAGVAGSAASLLSPIRVARISRLIGNSDTTGKVDGWQEKSVNQPESMVTSSATHKCALTHETPLDEWRFAVLHWSLASQQVLGDGLSTAPTADYPSGIASDGLLFLEVCCASNCYGL
jgi:hypothetical protein